jgi:hypothetical protein
MGALIPPALLIETLRQTADFHYLHCRDVDCAVSLWRLSLAAKLILRHVPKERQASVTARYLTDWPDFNRGPN